MEKKTVLGFLCGAGAALFWSVGFVAARHGVTTGLSPLVIALHRYVWPGLLLLPMIAFNDFGNLGGLGWRRGLLLAAFGGLPVALFSYTGNVFVPLGHGAVIQPSSAALGGMILARFALKEPLPISRAAGALAIVVGLAVIGAESLRNMNGQAVEGDVLFVISGGLYAVFAMLLRAWRMTPLRATAITSVLSLAVLPALAFRYDNMVAAGWHENLLQAVVQGGLAGAGATYLFARAVVLLGAGRAILFPSLVPPFTLLIAYFMIGEAPTVAQLIGLVVVVVGFQLTQKR
jgi:drug/metabolite transporter (DMT)-like permease